jgi:hypothetical protein
VHEVQVKQLSKDIHLHCGAGAASKNHIVGMETGFEHVNRFFLPFCSAARISRIPSVLQFLQRAIFSLSKVALTKVAFQ